MGSDLIELIDLSIFGTNSKPVSCTLDEDKVSVVSSLKTGSSNTFAQVTGSLQPTLNPFAIGGYSSLLFAGNQCLQSTSNITLSDWLIVSVVRTYTGNNVIYEASQNASAEDGLWAWSGTTGYLSSRAGPVYSYYTPGLTNDSTWRIVEQAYGSPGNHADHTIRYNGVLQSLTTAAGNNPGVSSFTKPWNIGARNGASNFLLGELAFLAICRFKSATNHQRLALRAYCARKFGFAL